MVGHSLSFSYLLHLLLPGLGHLFWREHLFGIFIFLVAALATVLFVVSILVSLPWLGAVVLYSLPLLFYAFTFFDLTRTVRLRRRTRSPGTAAVLSFLTVGIVYQALSPIAPVNFGYRNRPDIFVQDSNNLTPLYNRGDLLVANRLAYHLNIIAVKKPILHALPGRYDVVAFRNETGRRRCGIVVGLPREEIEIAGGVIAADGMPQLGEAPGGIVLNGEWPLTSVGAYSILVATLTLGRIEEVHEVPFPALVGKVSRVF